LKTPTPQPGRGLYAITDGPRADLLDVVAQALAGGTRLLQYRDLSDDTARRRAEATALAQLCRAHGVPLIIDHDIALALAVGADGVHLGRDDVAPREARARMPRAVIGVSCYDDVARARAAAADGADYIGIGSVFASTTKPGAVRASLELLSEAKSASGLPVAAIGGIDISNARAAVSAGADMLAVISALFEAGDVEAAARRFASFYR